ncbi:membrane dipeptidase [Sphingosinithalassobacter tenebrarum]|uniref:Membrane dipeptidase n=2 Tax=Stakelama tenebrarum TaxID=2711215 RepID=A0A6G6YAR5_9SPHN|nr:membrane dipeptidase [Sphingosinithalassobacter tenebrarum]
MKARTATFAALLLAGCATTPSKTSADVSRDQARAVHDRLLVLDTHLDTPMHFQRPGWDFGAPHDPATDLVQVDMVRMEAGDLDGGFFVIYTDQGPLTGQGYADALAFARARSDLIDSTLAKYPERIVPVTTAEEARAAAAQDKLIAFKSIENSYPLGLDLSHMKEFYDRGVRLMGPVHGANNQFADSATDDPHWNGLSSLGRQWLAEANRLGIVVDASHASDAAFDQMLALSTAPLLLSHSSARWAHDAPRNLDDARIRALAAKGGAICVSTIYLSDMHLEGERAELFEQYEHMESMTPAQQADLARRWRALDAEQPLWDADFETYMEQVLHVIDVAGVDHVCFAGDWDGGGGVTGFNDISALPLVTQRLLDAGYSEADLAKMWGGNVLRIVAAAQAAAE